jgi:hypothetical protein
LPSVLTLEETLQSAISIKDLGLKGIKGAIEEDWGRVQPVANFQGILRGVRPMCLLNSSDNVDHEGGGNDNLENRYNAFPKYDGNRESSSFIGCSQGYLLISTQHVRYMYI